MKKLIAAFGVVAGLAGAPAAAESWSLTAEGSKVAFGSVKKDTVGEVHTLSGLSGAVSADGAAKIDIDLASLETNIDIRNERMQEHVFKGAGTASIAMSIDMGDVSGLAVGASTTTFAEGTLSLLGAEVPLEAELFVLRAGEGQVLVTTDSMIFLGTEALGIDAGVDKLMELAKLPGITRTVPITVRLMFQLDAQEAGAAPEGAAATEATGASMDLANLGDAKKGRRVFNKCKACHRLEAGKNGVGPSLHAIFGATAGQVEGFRYSNAMAGSGIVWTPETLGAFVADPKGTVPKTKMNFRGLRKEADIANLLAYLAEKAMP